MLNKHFSRREFLKYSMIATGALTAQAFRPFYNPLDEQGSNNIARVTTESISVYSEPSDKSRILYQRTRDELINIYDEVISDDGPAYNPLWYRVWSGYVHSAYLQRVEIKFNPVQKNIPETGVLAEITVPLTQSMRLRKPYGWEPLYRLYYQSTHWITAVEEGPDGNLWYKLLDELLEVNYHVPAEHLRIIPPDELLPITPEIPSHKKRIEVSIGYQTVRAFEYDQLVFETKMSSGVPNRNPDPDAIPTDTPKGKFNIQSKMPSKHMGDGRLTSELFAYELPGVPWSCFFEPKTGVAFHGTYWHYNYGLQMSHGCVNLKPEEAKWIFRWSTPIADASTIETRGFGTPVIVT